MPVWSFHTEAEQYPDSVQAELWNESPLDGLNVIKKGIWGQYIHSYVTVMSEWFRDAVETGFQNSIFPHKAVPYWVFGRLTALCHRPGEKHLCVGVPPPVETHDSPETLLLFVLQEPRDAQVSVSIFSLWSVLFWVCQCICVSRSRQREMFGQ